MTQVKLALGAAAATLLLAACGGGGGSSTPEMSETQMQREDREASASVDGLIGFMKGQLTSSSDQADPRPVSGINPPASDSAEPQAL